MRGTDIGPPGEWLRPIDVARELSVSISTVRAMIRQRRIRARRLRGSRLLRVARADIEALLEPLGDGEPAAQQ
jgi:excisionase family DNA binding protein